MDPGAGNNAELGKVGHYKDRRKASKGLGFHQDHIIARSILYDDGETSLLREILKEIELAITVLPKDHKGFLTTGSSWVAKGFKWFHTFSILGNDVENTLRQAIIGSQRINRDAFDCLVGKYRFNVLC